MKLEDFINQLRYDFQMQSKKCFVANDDFWLEGCWDVYTKKDNKFVGTVFFNLDPKSTLNDVPYNQESKDVLTEIIDNFDLYHPIDQFGISVHLDDHGIHF